MDILRKIRNIPFIYVIYIRTIGKIITWYKETKKRKVFKKEALNIMREYMQVAREANVGVMCAFGTLLGVVRDNGLIPFDFDIDTALLKEEDRVTMERALLSHGYSKFRQFEVKDEIILQTWYKKGIYIDLFSVLHDEGGSVLYSFWRHPNKFYKTGIYEEYKVMFHQIPEISKVVTKRIYDFDVQIPENAEEVVETLYGKGWRVPDPKFVHHPPREEVMMVKEIYY